MSEEYKEEDKSSEGGEEKDYEARIPEEFQKKVHELLEGCDNRQCLDYVRSCVSECEGKMHRDEMAKEKGKNPKTMGVFHDDVN